MKPEPLFPLLGVNIDHVATLREARKIRFPDPTRAAMLAIEAGADFITAHLREDRRHIQDYDIENMREQLSARLNLEMAVTDEMLAFALKIAPADVCLVPEKRAELTTEGGLNVVAQLPRIREVCQALAESGIRVSLFVDPDPRQLDAARETGAPVVEIHTGHYASAVGGAAQTQLARVLDGIEYAHRLGFKVNAGHGLNYDNVPPIAAHPQVQELNIGHWLVAESVYVGIAAAVSRMKHIMLAARRETQR
jgi:pyridoxine 5-phosphate synthase